MCYRRDMKMKETYKMCGEREQRVGGEDEEECAK